MPSKNHTIEERLKFSELRYRRLFEAAQDGILILDAGTGNIVDVNPFLKKLLGYTRKELIGKKLWEIGVFKDVIDSKRAFIELKTKGYIRYRDLPLQTKEGKSVDVEFVSNLYMVDSVKVIQCNIRDISDRKNAEIDREKTKNAMLNIMEDLEVAKTVIEKEKAKDEAILASIGEGLVAVDNNRKVIIINKVAEEMLGYKSKEIIGRELTLLPLQDEEGNTIPLNKRPTYIALATGQLTEVSYYYVRKDKTRFPITIMATPINLGRKIIGLVEIIRDVTKEFEIDKAKSEFVSLASHQLRTPLGIIKWYLEALENEDYYKKAPVDFKKYFDEIYKSNSRVLSLVRDLLSVSRIDQRRVRDDPRLVDIMQLVTEVADQMKIIADKRGVRLLLDVRNRKKLFIKIDTLRFHEVLENLISNAIEYTKPNNEVVVIVDVLSDKLSISVKDSGIGISTADQKRLFTKFFRSEKAVNYNSEGSGLGLYVVKSYVEGWGGTITVESSENKGSTFTVNLPIKIGGEKNDKK